MDGQSLFIGYIAGILTVILLYLYLENMKLKKLQKIKQEVK